MHPFFSVNDWCKDFNSLTSSLISITWTLCLSIINFWFSFASFSLNYQFNIQTIKFSTRVLQLCCSKEKFVEFRLVTFLILYKSWLSCIPFSSSSFLFSITCFEIFLITCFSWRKDDDRFSQWVWNKQNLLDKYVIFFVLFWKCEVSFKSNKVWFDKMYPLSLSCVVS